MGFWYTRPRLWALRRDARITDAYLANSNAVKENVKLREGVSDRKIHVIHNCHRLESFDVPPDTGFLDRNGIPGDAKIVGIVANFRPVKRVDYLIAAFAEVRKAVPDAYLVVIGHPGGLGDKYGDMVRELGIADRVKMTGMLSDVVPLVKLELFSDHLDIITDKKPDEDLFFVDDLIAKVRREADLFHFPNLNENGVLARWLKVRRNGLRINFSEDAAPCIPIEANPDKLFEGMIRKKRHDLKRVKRALIEKHGARFVRALSGPEIDQGLDDLFRLHLMRSRDKGILSTFCGDEIVEFHRDLARKAADQGWLRLYRLELDRKVVGAAYGFFYLDKFCYHQTGFDPDVARLGPGNVMIQMIVDDICADGAKELDLLRGRTPFKLTWTKNSRTAPTCTVYNKGLTPALEYGFSALRDFAKAGMTRVLGGLGESRAAGIREARDRASAIMREGGLPLLLRKATRLLAGAGFQCRVLKLFELDPNKPLEKVAVRADVECRVASEDDVLSMNSKDYGYDDEGRRYAVDRIAGGDTCIVAACPDRRIGGYIWVMRHSMESSQHRHMPVSDKRYYVYKGFVREDLRGQRILAALDYFIIDLARREGCTSIVTTVDRKNFSSIRAKERIGFRQIGRIFQLHLAGVRMVWVSPGTGRYLREEARPFCQGFAPAQEKA